MRRCHWPESQQVAHDDMCAFRARCRTVRYKHPVECWKCGRVRQALGVRVLSHCVCHTAAGLCRFERLYCTAQSHITASSAQAPYRYRAVLILCRGSMTCTAREEYCTSASCFSPRAGSLSRIALPSYRSYYTSTTGKLLIISHINNNIYQSPRANRRSAPRRRRGAYTGDSAAPSFPDPDVGATSRKRSGSCLSFPPASLRAATRLTRLEMLTRPCAL